MANHHEIVKKLIESKAVDFNAIGKIVAEMGPSIAFADEPWENFCSTMRHFIRLYRLPGPTGPFGPIENLSKLGQQGSELR